MSIHEHREFVNVYQNFPEGMKAVLALEQACHSGPLDPFIYELVKMRASQINGCAHCLDMHYKDARAMGETEERLYMLNAWRESKLYSPAERAALALTEEVTLIAKHHVSAEVEAEARKHFDARTYANLLFTIATINVWNRLAIASHSPAGEYKSTKQKLK
ncbi:MAG TPA: carboxymuconolactone decarboxylase family protein [Turneriella sp.]|nr:carboxymuconolactone decarboxylase family protein [Turneriella sp.]